MGWGGFVALGSVLAHIQLRGDTKRFPKRNQRGNWHYTRSALCPLGLEWVESEEWAVGWRATCRCAGGRDAVVVVVCSWVRTRAGSAEHKKEPKPT